METTDNQPLENTKLRIVTKQLKKIVTFLTKWKSSSESSGKGGEPKKDKTAILVDLKNAFGHINPKKTIILLIVGVLATYLLSGVYTVNPGEQAVVRRFGAVLPQVVSEGLHYRLPFPIDQVQKVNVSEIRRADIGMLLPEHIHQPNEEPQDIQLLTGDENIVTVKAIVHYKVKDPIQFLYDVATNSEQLMRLSVEAAFVRLMANTPIDAILGNEKVSAQNAIISFAQEALDTYQSGMQITAFNIQTIEPPKPVSAAFLDVTTAREEKETLINEANGYYNSLIPQARSKANKLVSNSESYKEEQISRAIGDTKKFLSMLAEYQNNIEIYSTDTTKYRMLLETLDKVLPKLKMYILDSSDGSIDIKLFDPKTSGIGIS
ncbi:FtsH protease activity modulator HflK [Macellibacteroides fermentans]|uniref:FtsH protease activity modulator HflK n=1 Tax=Macellibacteroides fermentans TaxID=879969 RepID=UPI00406C2252